MLALTVVVCVAIYEGYQASRMRAQNQTLEQEKAQLASQIEQRTHERDTTAGELASLRNGNDQSSKHPDELLRLRGEVALLREKLSEIGTARAQSVTQSSPTSQPDDALEQQKRMATGKGVDGRGYAMQLIMFAADHDGWFPTNWEHVAGYAKDYPTTGTNSFEMAYQGPLNRSGLGTNAGRTVLVREYTAWPTFDGKWGKIYGFADGHSDAIILPDGNFAAWEGQNTFSPDPPPK